MNDQNTAIGGHAWINTDKIYIFPRRVIMQFVWFKQRTPD